MTQKRQNLCPGETYPYVIVIVMVLVILSWFSCFFFFDIHGYVHGHSHGHGHLTSYVMLFPKKTYVKINLMIMIIAILISMVMVIIMVINMLMFTVLILFLVLAPCLWIHVVDVIILLPIIIAILYQNNFIWAQNIGGYALCWWWCMCRYWDLRALRFRKTDLIKFGAFSFLQFLTLFNCNFLVFNILSFCYFFLHFFVVGNFWLYTLSGFYVFRFLHFFVIFVVV